MVQARRETHQQVQPPTPLKCPRCNSLDTRFRYFNNNNLAQPRYNCKTCKRQWTVGGNLRNVRNNKQTKASSSRTTVPQFQPQQPPLPLREEQLQYSQSLAPMETPVPQNFDITMSQPVINVPTAVSPSNSYYIDEEISSWDVIQSLIQADIVNQNGNVGYQFVSGGANMPILHDRNIQSMASTQPLQLQILRNVEHYQVSSATPHLCTNSFSASNANLENNCTGNIINNNAEIDSTFVNVDTWLNLSDHDSP